MRVTGLGSMPGRDFREATRIVAELQPDVLAWPEVPARDASSTMIGRTLGLLELPVNLTDDGWRLAAAKGSAQLRAERWWRSDLDDFEELTQGHQGVVKVALAGPWTLATSLRLTHPTMTHVLADEVACQDLAQALAEAVAGLVARLRARLGREVVIQIDEPVIGTVLGGTMPTFSGLQHYRVPARDEVQASWQGLVAAAGSAGVDAVWLHSCGPDLDLDLARRAGLDAVALDARFVNARTLDEIGGWLDVGRTLALGIVRTDQVAVPTVDAIVTAALRVLRPLELDPELLDAAVLLTPACGLGLWPADQAARLLERLPEAAELVAEQLRR